MLNILSRIIILLIIFCISTSLSNSTNFSGNPIYVPKVSVQKHVKKNDNKRGLIVKKYHKAGRHLKDTLGLSRGLSAHIFHQSGRRRGMALGLSRGLRVSQFHKNRRREGISLGLSRGLNVSKFHKSGRKRSSLGLSRGLNVSKFHKSGRKNRSSLGLSRGLNVRQFHNSGRREKEFFGLSRGLNVRNFHKAGRQNRNTLGLSRGLNVKQFNKAGRLENECFGLIRGLNASHFHKYGRNKRSEPGLSRGLNVSKFHKKDRHNNTSIGLSRGQLEYEIDNCSNVNSNTLKYYKTLHTFLFQNISNDNPLTHYLAKTDEWFDLNSKKNQNDKNISDAQQKIPFITPLSPDHVGFTTNNTPEIFWYISSPWKGVLEFTINEVDTLNPDPVLYVRIKSIEKKGIYSFNLKDLSVSLKENLEYEFFIAIVMDEIEKSANIVASCLIKYIKADNSFIMQMAKVPLYKDYYLYAENGFFFDAIDHLSEVIIQSGFDEYFKCHRASLLRQVGLDMTAQYDCTK